MLEPYIYWHAPLWEVILIGTMSLGVVVWLTLRAPRRPSLGDALAAIDPALNQQSLFFFDRVSGVLPLNSAATQSLQNLASDQRPFLLEVLADTLSEAYEEGRPAQHAGWPTAEETLIALPIHGKSTRATDVLGVVIRTASIAPSPSEDVGLQVEHSQSLPVAVADLPAQVEAWLMLGIELRVHRARPIVQVRQGSTWQERTLSHTEETLLRHLLTHPAEVQAAETLFAVAWPDDAVSRYGLRPEQKDRLRRLIYQLRQRVEPDPRNPRYIYTAHGVGYAFYPDQNQPP